MRSESRDAAQAWTCNRKKAYSTEKMAEKVAKRMTRENRDPATARPGYANVEVVSYGCGLCGRWHVGRRTF